MRKGTEKTKQEKKEDGKGWGVGGIPEASLSYPVPGGGDKNQKPTSLTRVNLRAGSLRSKALRLPGLALTFLLESPGFQQKQLPQGRGPYTPGTQPRQAGQAAPAHQLGLHQRWD